MASWVLHFEHLECTVAPSGTVPRLWEALCRIWELPVACDGCDDSSGVDGGIWHMANVP